MTIEALDWAPAEVVRSEKVRIAFDRIAAAWSQAWFPRHPLTVSRIETLNRPTLRQLAAEWAMPHRSVLVSTSGKTRHRLSAWALDLKTAGAEFTDADRELLDSMETAILADLARRIEDACGPDARSDAAGPSMEALTALGGAMVKFASEDGAEVASAAAPLPAFARLVRQPTPGRRLRQPTLHSPADAASASLVSLDAIIGAAQISLGELRGLGPGDVIVLDRLIEQPIDLRLRGGPAPLAQATLRAADGPTTLVIHQASRE